MLKYREDGALGTKEEPSTTTQEHLSLCTDQNHGLAQQGISWEDFISCDFFTVPQPPPEIVCDEGGPSQQFDIPEPGHVSSPQVVTYQRGHMALFACARRVLSPHQVEGVSPSSSAQRVLSPLHVEGASLSTVAQVQERGK